MNVVSPAINSRALEICPAFDKQDFLKNYWQQKPLLIRQLFPDFKDPLSAEELAGLACEELCESRLVTEFDIGHWSLQQGPFNEEHFSNLPESNWTLLVQAVDQWLEEVREIKNCFDFIPSWRIEDIMISYAAKQGSVGPHFDYYDVFLIQGQGKRHWQVGEQCATDVALQEGSELGILETFRVQQEYTLEPGDALYLPPRFAHWGSAIEAGLCYSVGFRTPSLGEMLEGYSDSLIASMNLASRFTDPNPEPPLRSGEILPQSLLQSFSQVLSKLDSIEDFSAWFAGYVTQPKYPELIAPPTTEIALEDFVAALEGGLVLLKNPSSRFAFIELDASQDSQIQFYVDGIAKTLPASCLNVVTKICELSSFNQSVISQSEPQEPAIELLWQLVKKGSLVIDED